MADVNMDDDNSNMWRDLHDFFFLVLSNWGKQSISMYRTAEVIPGKPPLEFSSRRRGLVFYCWVSAMHFDGLISSVQDSRVSSILF